MVASLFASFIDNQSQRYSIYHVWKAYYLLRQKGSLGRKELAHELDLGEGTIRTMFEKMREDESIECTRRGARLTDQGARRLDSLGIDLRPLENCTDLTIDRCNIAVLARGMAQRVKDGCEQRDEAVKAGATGATTLVRKEGRMVFAGDENYPGKSTSDLLNKLFRAYDDDVVIIGTAGSTDMAERGAVVAALKLHTPSFQCWKEGGLISEYMDPGDLRCLAQTFHELVGYMPFAIRTKNQLGILCEEGLIVSERYTGPFLEEALRTGKTVKTTPDHGYYRGVPVICVPICKNGKAIAVMGLVDTTKLSVHDIMGRVRREGLSPTLGRA